MSRRTGLAELPLHGGQDGTPYPVDRETYDRTIDVLQAALQRTTVERSEKIKALKRLGNFANVRIKGSPVS